MGDCSKMSDDQPTQVVSTIAYPAKENQVHRGENKAVHFELDEDADKITANEAEKRLDDNLWRNILGFALGVLASMLIAVGTSCTQALQGAVPDLELATFRGLALLLCSTPYFIVKQQFPAVKRESRIWILPLGISQCGFALFMFIAVRYVPLGVAGALLRVALLLTITVLARFILKEKITIVKLTSIVLSILAVFLVIQPTFLFGDSKETEKEKTIINNLKDLTNSMISFMKEPLPDEIWKHILNSTAIPDQEEPGVSTVNEILGYVMMILSGVSGAVTTTIQKSKFSDLNPLVLNVWTSLFLILVPLVLSLAIEFDDLTFPTDVGNILLVLGQSFASALSFIAAFRGMKMTTAIWLTLALSMQIFFLIIAQYTFLHDINPGKDNWIEIFGAAVVVVAAVIPPIWEIIKTKYEARSKAKKIHPVK